MDNRSIQVARYILGFSWIYHGLFPKLIAVAPLEKALTATIGLSDHTSYLVTISAGVLEVFFGILIIVFYQNSRIILANIVTLVVLCIFVAIQMPGLLIEAFNPVTTNLALIGLSYVLLRAKSA
ncbi:DoxX-like family protein [Zhongshania sp. BJYM1]|uniref:DoxX-like family protein n=1 Tax=Zhongshania aquatica TaxID=2965069 RepID=UPI0022B3D39B|nr:DoxX-like family protein [Marortus sp. BJYM1]